MKQHCATAPRDRTVQTRSLGPRPRFPRTLRFAIFPASRSAGLIPCAPSGDLRGTRAWASLAAATRNIKSQQQSRFADRVKCTVDRRCRQCDKLGQLGNTRMLLSRRGQTLTWIGACRTEQATKQLVFSAAFIPSRKSTTPKGPARTQANTSVCKVT